MRKKLLPLIITSIIFLFFIYSLSDLKSDKEYISCIKPETTFAYEVSANINQYPALPITPSGKWHVESVLPKNSLELLSVTLADNKGQDLWFLAPPNFTNDTNIVIRYNTISKTWDEVELAIKKEEETIYSIRKIFTTTNGEIWSFNYASKFNESPELIPVLSKYNVDKKIFNFVENTSKISNKSTDQSQIVNIVLLDTNDIFWMLIPYNGIYSFNSRNYELKKHVSLENINVNDADISLDGDIFILDRDKLVSISDDPAFSFRRGAIYHYSTSTNELSEINYPLEPYPFPLSLLIDKSNRLWIGGLGWMDSDNKWYQIIRRPEFITTKLDLGGIGVYRWQQPIILMQSSNGILWFTSPNGMISLDPEKGEWCWFTTYQSNIVEDSDRNLWMIADNKLYKLPLGEQ